MGWPLYLITPSGHVKGNSEKGALRLANESYEVSFSRLNGVVLLACVGLWTQRQ